MDGKRAFDDRKRNLAITIPLVILFICVGFLAIFPFYCLLLGSLKPPTELMRFGLNVRLDWDIMSFKNYSFLFDGSTNYLYWYRSSLTITIIQTVASLFFSAAVAYGFAMYDFKLKNVLFTCVLITMMVPGEILMLPQYKLVTNLGLIDSYAGVILPGVVGAMPVFFFRQFLSGLPKDFIDAGRVDGCSEYGIFVRIFFPLMAPSFAAMGILIGMGAWNGFLWPLIVLRDQLKLTLPLGLATLQTPYGNNYAVILSGSVIAIIPIFILFLCFQRYFIDGMTAGAVKG